MHVSCQQGTGSLHIRMIAKGPWAVADGTWPRHVTRGRPCPICDTCDTGDTCDICLIGDTGDTRDICVICAFGAHVMGRMPAAEGPYPPTKQGKWRERADRSREMVGMGQAARAWGSDGRGTKIPAGDLGTTGHWGNGRVG